VHSGVFQLGTEADGIAAFLSEMFNRLKEEPPFILIPVGIPVEGRKYRPSGENH